MDRPVSPNFKPAEEKITETDFNKSSPLEKLTVFKKVNEPRFGKIDILQNPQTKDFIAAAEHKFNDQKAAGAFIAKAKALQNSNHPNIVKLLDYSVAKQSELCSSYYIIKLFFEYPKSDLKKESIERKTRGERFTPNELNEIGRQQESALNYLHENGKFHGDVQPLMIGYNKDTRETKLIPNLDLDSESAVKNNLKNRFVKNEGFLATPNTFSSIASGTTNFKLNPAEEDKYNLNLSLIELANQKSVLNIYNKAEKKVDQNALQNHIQDATREYGANSAEFTNKILNLNNIHNSNQSTNQQITTINDGGHIHTIVKTRAETLTVQGVSLFDGIDRDNLDYSNIKKETETKVNSAPPNESNIVYNYKPNNFTTTETIQNNFRPAQVTFAQATPNSSSSDYYFYDGNIQVDHADEKQLVNLDEIVNQNNDQNHHIYKPPQFVNTENKRVYASPPVSSNVEYYQNPIVTYSQEPIKSEVVYSTPPYTTTNTTTIIEGNVTDLSGLKLIKTYTDPTLATNNKNY